jgi:hypothetical protein
MGLVVLGVVVIGTVIAGGSALMSRPQASESHISVTVLRPPPEYVADMNRFLIVEDDHSTRFGRGRPGAAPLHGSAIWGHYINVIDEEPWKSQLLAQAEAVTARRDWPSLPLSGPILNEPQFQGRVLELYVSVDVLPSRSWAQEVLAGRQVSVARTRGTVGTPCHYGQECLSLVAIAEGLTSPVQEQRLWMWRIGRVVITVSALGASGWPENRITPLVQYYATMIPSLRGVHDDNRSAPAPAAARLTP